MKLALLVLVLMVIAQSAVYDEGIALVSGESWPLYQGYTITFRGVDIGGSLVWLDISQNGTVVVSRVVPLGTSLAVYRGENGLVSVHGTAHDLTEFENESTATKVLQVDVVDVYTGSYHDMVLLKVVQYTDPALPPSVPVALPSSTPTIHGTQATPQSVPSGVVGWEYVVVVVVAVLVLVLVLVRRLK